MSETTQKALRTVLITGGATGIGRAIALRFAKAEGYRLAINYVVQPDIANAFVAELQAAGCEAMAVYADVSNQDEVNAMFKEVDKAWGGVDILVNNAGITRDGLAMRLSAADWQDVLNVNLNSAFYCSQAAMRYMMRQRWGRIVNMSSVVGVNGNAGQINYSASKAALIGLTKSLAKELASRGITVNALAPGFIRSAMTDKLSEEQKNAILESIPMGLLGEPEDVAAVAFFLASEEARYITGQVVNINGGMA